MRAPRTPRTARGAPRGLLAAALAALLLPAAAPAVDLEGTWYVLVHYKDDATNHPERERWQDRLWVFEAQGEKLAWTDYPIVVFEDESGRFESLGTNRQSRVMDFWEPNAEQLEDIADGLAYNTRGKRTKTLERGSGGEGGWSSEKKGGGYSSARFITYQETWTIDDPEARPRFAWGASMGSATSEDFEGMTVFQTTAVHEDGDVLVGTFQRDGTRHGTFRAMRTATGETLKSQYASDGERAYQALFGNMGDQLFAGEIPGGVSEEDVRGRIEAGELTEQERRDLRVTFEEAIANSYRAQGNADLRAHRPQIQGLARKMTGLFADEGKSIEEIRAMLKDGRLRP